MSKRRRLVTELDYQILLLEHKKKLSTFERIKLDNLRERKQAMEEAGVELTATVVFTRLHLSIRWSQQMLRKH